MPVLLYCVSAVGYDDGPTLEFVVAYPGAPALTLTAYDI